MRVDFEPLDLWNRFQEAFKSAAETWDAKQLRTVWQKDGYRTGFVKDLAGRIASALGLELEHELWKVDFAMSVVSEGGAKVPVIFLEAENKIKTVGGDVGEVRKLCCHSAPLKVLVTVAEWDETPDVWKGRSLRSGSLRMWQDILRSHALVWPHRGLFGVIVGEWSDSNGTTARLRFYANAIQPDGSLLYPQEDSIIFERQLPKHGIAQSA